MEGFHPYMRAATNAILYLLRTGSPWRYLPCDGFSPRSTVYNIFRKFQREGVWEADLGRIAHGVARADGARSQPLGCGSRQPIGQISGKGRGKDDALGYDADKKVKGRKIHTLAIQLAIRRLART